MSDWNPNDYQGRSRKQVEGAYRINSIIMALLAVGLIALTIFA